MRCASDQLTKRMAFDQMHNVWSNARAFGQMRAHLTKHCAFGQMPCVLPMTDALRIWPNAQIGQMRLTVVFVGTPVPPIQWWLCLYWAYTFYRLAPLLMTLSDLKGHSNIYCFCGIIKTIN